MTKIAKKKVTKKKGTKVVQSKKTVYKGIEFASSLEATMCKLLDEAGISYKYEPKSYTTLETFTYEGECYERVRKTSKEMVDRPKVLGVSYTPDFVGLNEEFFIEVKGRANESFPLRWKLFKEMLMNTREEMPILFKPMTVADCKQVVEVLKSKGYGK